MGLLVRLGAMVVAVLATQAAPAFASGTAPPVAPLATYPRITYHADTEFTDYERILLAQAQSNVALQTSGVVTFNLVYDFDAATGSYDTPAGPYDASTHWLLRRTEGNGVAWVEWYDNVIQGTLLGLTKRVEHEVFIFVDRLPYGTTEGSGRFVHVAMHEALHAAGVEHTEGGAIMGPLLPRGRAPTCLNALDALAVCGALKCDPRVIAFCLP